MKKTVLTATLACLIGLAGLQMANAVPGYGPGTGPGPGPGCSSCPNPGGPQQAAQLSEEDRKALESFREETTAVRRELAVKGAELNALLRQDNPDEKKVAALTGELFDLRNQLRAKAREKNLPFAGEGCGGAGGAGGCGSGCGPGRPF